MSEPRTILAERLMKHAARLMTVPKVQVERAVGPILGLFIPEVFSEQQWGKHSIVVGEEFPLRKPTVDGVSTFQSTNIDWLLYNMADRELVFVELKMTDTSFDDSQAQAYLRVIDRIRRCGSSFLVEDLEAILPVSLEREKYRNVVNRVRTTGYSNCNKARLIYLAPATIKEKREPHTAGVEWLAFEDLPREIGGELRVEWTAIYNGLVELGRTARTLRTSAASRDERRNYADTCGFTEVVNFCQENGDRIVVGFAGGAKALRAASLDDLNRRRSFKWDLTQTGTGHKDPRNWISGRTFLELVAPLIDPEADPGSSAKTRA